MAAGGTVNTKSRRHDVPAKIQRYITITRVYEIGKLLGDSFSLSWEHVGLDGKDNSECKVRRYLFM